ncbi:hypothetical protein GALL_515940 [mine drainage metagenome]|uniref:Uncharacterized protein n=1 Tax=mine drainage metagenome TaxID=410659 RepID=A0A1J5P5L9_9ZZZZ
MLGANATNSRTSRNQSYELQYLVSGNCHAEGKYVTTVIAFPIRITQSLKIVRVVEQPVTI